VTRIEVLNPISYIALRRNEVKEKTNVLAVEKWAEGREDPQPLWADGDRSFLGTDERGRTQRQTMALRNVRYRIHGEIRPWPGYEGKQSSLDSQFQRRVDHGKCLYQPYFGCREFPAYFQFPEDNTPPHAITQDLGLMLYDVFNLSKPATAYDAPQISLFRARLNDGVMSVPEFDSDEVLKPRREG
jgi:CRISPR-associated protein Cas5d